MITAQEMRTKTKSELVDSLKNLKQEQMNLRFQKTYDQLNSPMRVKEVRRQIARIKTVLNDNTYKGAK